MVWPDFARSVMTLKTSSAAMGSRALVGSSKRMAEGLTASARAMATRCCWPPDNSSGFECSFSGKPTRVSNSLRARLGLIPRPAQHKERPRHDILKRGHVRE